jgi:hypothetical protein
MKRFVDDFSVLAIEQCLVEKLPNLFMPQMVYDLTDEDVTSLAGESESATAERQRINDKFRILTAGLQDLKLLDKHRPDTSGNAGVPCFQASVLLTSDFRCRKRRGTRRRERQHWEQLE